MTTNTPILWVCSGVRWFHTPLRLNTFASLQPEHTPLTGRTSGADACCDATRPLPPSGRLPPFAATYNTGCIKHTAIKHNLHQPMRQGAQRPRLVACHCLCKNGPATPHHRKHCAHKLDWEAGSAGSEPPPLWRLVSGQASTSHHQPRPQGAPQQHHVLCLLGSPLMSRMACCSPTHTHHTAHYKQTAQSGRGAASRPAYQPSMARLQPPAQRQDGCSHTKPRQPTRQKNKATEDRLRKTARDTGGVEAHLCLGHR
jgi:hypothetical protein